MYELTNGREGIATWSPSESSSTDNVDLKSRLLKDTDGYLHSRRADRETSTIIRQMSVIQKVYDSSNPQQKRAPFQPT